MLPVIITAACVGAELTKKDTPYLPVTADEIVAEAVKVFQAGARIFHLHVRDSKGRPSCDPQRIRSVSRRIREATDLIVQVSTGGAIGDGFAERLQTLDAPVEMGSLTMGSINFGNDVFSNPRPLYEALAKKMAVKGIKPEFEIFDLAMLDNVMQLARHGLIRKPFHYNFVLGVPGALPATCQNLALLIERIPRGSSWSVAGMGRAEFVMARLALARGGHVRVGLEDNVYIAKGRLAQGSDVLVAKVASMVRKYGRQLASPQEARKVLGL